MIDPRDHRGRCLDEDVYVLGSGPSLNHVPARFFDGKAVVSTNHGCTFAGITPTYLVTKYHRHAREYGLTHPGIPVVVTRHDTGNHRNPVIGDFDGIVVDHNHNVDGDWTPEMWPTDPHALVATWSTITTAMHWAAYLGAANIIMVGHDCGRIDDVGRIPGYRDASRGPVDPPGDADSFMWQAFDAQSRMVKAELIARYGVTVTSLNPFLNVNMEGHAWRSFAGTLNG